VPPSLQTLDTRNALPLQIRPSAPPKKISHNPIGLRLFSFEKVQKLKLDSLCQDLFNLSYKSFGVFRSYFGFFQGRMVFWGIIGALPQIECIVQPSRAILFRDTLLDKISIKEGNNAAVL
jgi:hypothetical protein